MSVETVLTKLSQHNDEVLGCIVRTGDRVYANLPDRYSLVDAPGVAEQVENMFALMDELETEDADFDQLFLEYEHHSFYARRLGDAVLLLLNKPIKRAAFKKMKVGVNLFVKPLVRAIDAEANAPAEPLAAEKPAEEKPEKKSLLRKRFYRGVEY